MKRLLLTLLVAAFSFSGIAQDDCATATTINCGDVDVANTVGYGVDSPPFCGTGNGTGGGIWYKTVANCTSITASLCSSLYDTKIRVYSGTCGALVCVTGNDDFCGLQSEVTWAATPGTTYYILVHGYGSSEGTYTLTMSCSNCCASMPPTADFVADPVTVCQGSDVNFTDASTCGATSWSWSFPGGTPSTSTAQNPTVTYSTIGTYDVTLTATNAFGNDIETKTGHINVVDCSQCATDLDVGPHNASYTSTMVRGYYFTSPISFEICELYVPDDMNTQMQHVEVVRFNNGPPPAWASTTNDFTSLFNQTNYVPNTPIPCNITVNAGDIIGVYGARGNTTTMYNSYNAPTWNTLLDGNPITLYRSGMQYTLFNSSMHDIWSEVSYSIGRVIFRYGVLPLPVELGSFEGYSQGRENVLEWTTVTEQNADYFSIQKKGANGEFYEIGTVQAAGESQTEIDYTFIDQFPTDGVNYYRLEQFDFDGSAEYSHVIAIDNDASLLLNVFPNPADKELYLSFKEPLNGDAQPVVIRDAVGKIVLSEDVYEQVNKLDISGLPNGVYMIETIINDKVMMNKFVKK